MMKNSVKSMLSALASGLAVVMLAACGGPKFNIEGTVEGAADRVVYFENIGLSGIEVLDSARLDQSGQFAFSGAASDAPEFYRLRIEDQIINISIDSTETVSVKAQWPGMASNYEVSGSDNCLKIKELALKQMELQQRAIALQNSLGMNRQAFLDSLNSMVATYKQEVTTDYIFREPYKSYAYFALFQTLGPWLIFDPKSNPDDVKVFAAVATSWDTYYPGATRGENLHNIAIEGMKNVRIASANQTGPMIESEKVVQSGVIDIALTDNKGREQRLTDQKGKVVLLDFHVFGMEDSPKRILMLREVYNKYHAQGLEIFQVSLDADEHFWKQQTAALPWISVRDEQGLQSQRLMLYNIQSLPEFFLIDRQNNLVKRSGQMSDLEAEIRKLL